MTIFATTEPKALSGYGLMRSAAATFAFIVLLWIISDTNDVCGSDAGCHVSLEAPQ